VNSQGLTRAKHRLLEDLADGFSQCEMDDFVDAVEREDDARARKIVLRNHANGFSEEDVAYMIEETRRRIIADRKENPTLVVVSDLMTDEDTPRRFRNDLGLLIDTMKLADAPKPVGRHDRTGLLWRRDELVAWLKTKKPKERS